jgi:hypothetical protein
MPGQRTFRIVRFSVRSNLRAPGSELDLHQELRGRLLLQ